jgi:hypothetical protein
MVDLSHGQLARQLSALHKSVREIFDESEKLDFIEMNEVMAQLENVEKVLEVERKDLVRRRAQEALQELIEHSIAKVLQKYLQSENGRTNVLRRSAAMLDKSADEISLFSDQVQKALTEALSSSQSSLEFLIDAGIANRDGGLSSKYLIPEKVDHSKGSH